MTEALFDRLDTSAPRAGPDFRLEAALGPGPVAGIDEAGRGPWAGPVVAAAVVFKPGEVPHGLNDSKKLKPEIREELYGQILACASVGIGIAGVDDIERNNILGATFHAMQRAYADLAVVPRAALVDGNQIPALPCAAHAVVKGDGLSVSIAAASIVAKVTRDRIMMRLAREHPGYGWERNKGYGTAEHIDALGRLVVTPHHRLSYAPIKRLMSLNKNLMANP